MIPVIDIFAGPGGLGEGFAALANNSRERIFEIVLSIEKDEHAHRTLTLRSFFRQFKPNSVPDDYYEFVRGNIDLEELYKRWPKEANHAQGVAWLATLGNKKRSTPHAEVDARIKAALRGRKEWVLIGGPPCQAYSVIGRVRKKRRILNEKKDEKVGLYKQYLRILAVHCPTIFVMENVPGLLTAKTKGSSIFEKMLADLSDPVSAYKEGFSSNGQQLLCPGYKIYSLVKKPEAFDAEGIPQLDHKDYLIASENYGIPQTRHRVILLGVRRDIELVPGTLRKKKNKVAVSQVIDSLPKLRSKISRSKDDGQEWRDSIMKLLENYELEERDRTTQVSIQKRIRRLSLPSLGTGQEFIQTNDSKPSYKKQWYFDSRLKGISNHVARSHMSNDLRRYFFAACFAQIHGRSPHLADFPSKLLPEHSNVYDKTGRITKKFADRFKVQLKNKPSKTITSHISQDGHYYIHYDPNQCRSFTVREAARIQTFPDNYYFCGPRTYQFIQVGNAVPPLLAIQIAKIVSRLIDSIVETNALIHNDCSQVYKSVN